MLNRLAFVHGTLITDSGPVPDSLVLSEAGRITYAGPWAEIPPDCTVIDAIGLHVSPGFIDIHVHGAAGSDFMDATPEDLHKIFAYHARHGVTAFGLPDYNAQVLVFFIITVAAAEVAVGLAIIVALYRLRQTTHVEDLNRMKF